MGCGASSAAGAVPPTQQTAQEAKVQQAPAPAAAPAAAPAPAPQQEQQVAAPVAEAKHEEKAAAPVAAAEVPAPASFDHLFQAGKIGDIEVKNRCIMAPMTRCRATPRTHVPTPIMATYYGQRASAGLIVTECTMVSPDQSAAYADPGIYSDAQVAGWKAVTEAVHAKGGKVICQIWHPGRAAHSINGPNEDASTNPKPVAPSAIAIKAQMAGHSNPTGEKIDYEVPHELTEEEIAAVIGDFVKAAQNAIAAGFDGVEVHGANGYLIDQFWRASSNQRPAGRYSGATVETRSQFAIDVVAAVAAAIGAGKVGIRISPLNSFNEMVDPEPEQLTRYLCAKLAEMKIAFVHLMRADFFQAQKGDAVTWVREAFKGGFFISNMGYQPEEANSTIGAGTADAIAFGAVYTANPDLVERVQKGVALATPDYSTFYSGGEKGYIDYPTAA
jgi:N-ethylmaleimide reductase